MAAMQIVLSIVDVVAAETLLFAAIGLAIGGLDDLLVDALYLIRWTGRRLRGADAAAPTLAALPPPRCGGKLAVFIAAWDESAVIGAMLRTALGRFDHDDYRLYVGVYPNDRATIDAVFDVAQADARVRLVIGERAGPTTKADCLNILWRALLADERAAGAPVRAVVLHDAEDLVHAGELRVYDHFLERADVVQIPVLPLVDRRSRMVSGHYLDEFAEAHGKVLLVRQALGAAMPLAGVGCAIARPMLGRIAAMRGGLPFDADSLTEDYELGLTIAALRGRAVFARVAEGTGGPPVAVRAFFPGRLDDAVRQKARWMTGIALAGWDRVGWGRPLDLGDHWMRMRDRRAIVAVLILAAAYVALIAWGLAALGHWWLGSAPAMPSPALQMLLIVNAALLGWRLAARAAFVGAAYGRTEAALSVPRMLVANLIALLAARRAMVRYVGLLRGQTLHWDKTAHHFPDLAADGSPR